MTIVSFEGIPTENRVIHITDPLTAGNEEATGWGIFEVYRYSCTMV